MSGGILFSGDRYWGKAGWCYRATLRAICEALEEMNVDDDCGLLNELTDEHGSAQIIEFIEAENWDQNKLMVFFKAIELGFKNCERDGAKNWRDPSFFPGFLEGYKELLELINGVKSEISS